VAGAGIALSPMQLAAGFLRNKQLVRVLADHGVPGAGL
jgi:hypothetical protein